MSAPHKHGIHNQKGIMLTRYMFPHSTTEELSNVMLGDFFEYTHKVLIEAKNTRTRN